MYTGFTIPEHYRSRLSLKQTENAIKLIKDFFQQNLATELQLRKISAPLAVKKGTGINDDLNGHETPVTFITKDTGKEELEIVQSLAKWKRMILADYRLDKEFGIYTDMNALRPDEILDNLHSIHVDQWDWEKIIRDNERTIETLKKIVSRIYGVIRRTEFFVYEHFPDIVPTLPEDIYFIHAQQLIEMYPDLTPKEREHKITEEKRAVFIIGMGAKLSNGKPHEDRAPDYDDWITPDKDGHKGLNGDILLWNPVLKCAVEISSMGIRVNERALKKQLVITDTEERLKLYWHKRMLKGEYPQTIGGGIGQSRLNMFYLRKAHIGEVLSSVWPDSIIRECKENGIILL